jgi:hypothetical protein
MRPAVGAKPPELAGPGTDEVVMNAV